MFLAEIKPPDYVCYLKRYDTETDKDTFDPIRKELTLLRARVNKGGYNPAVKVADKLATKSPQQWNCVKTHQLLARRNVRIARSLGMTTRFALSRTNVVVARPRTIYTGTTAVPIAKLNLTSVTQRRALK